LCSCILELLTACGCPDRRGTDIASRSNSSGLNLPMTDEVGDELWPDLLLEKR
jgi:hypothetical protein